MEFLVGWSKNPIVYAKVNQRNQYQDEATAAMKSNKKDENKQIEVGFVDRLFEMYKLRNEITKARAEIISTSSLQGYRHKFRIFLCNSLISFRSTTIDYSILEEKK